MKKNIYYIMIVLVVLMSITFSFVLYLQHDKNISQEKLFTESIRSVVEVKATTENVGESFGSAVFVSKDGTLVTNAHVVTYKKLGETNVFENISIRFAFENDYRIVTLEKYDNNLDIAVLKLIDNNCSFKAVKFANSNSCQSGNVVYAVGNLNNIGISLTKGIVSNPSINVEYDSKTRNVIQCDITIAEGNSGGALFDSKGKLLGITTFRLKDSSKNVIYGIAYCVPANAVLEYIK